jgi:hypothetical protein
MQFPVVVAGLVRPFAAIDAAFNAPETPVLVEDDDGSSNFWADWRDFEVGSTATAAL